MEIPTACHSALYEANEIFFDASTTVRGVADRQQSFAIVMTVLTVTFGMSRMGCEGLWDLVGMRFAILLRLMRRASSLWLERRSPPLDEQNSVLTPPSGISLSVQETV